MERVLPGAVVRVRVEGAGWVVHEREEWAVPGQVRGRAENASALNVAPLFLTRSGYHAITRAALSAEREWSGNSPHVRSGFTITKPGGLNKMRKIEGIIPPTVTPFIKGTKRVDTQESVLMLLR